MSKYFNYTPNVLQKIADKHQLNISEIDDAFENPLGLTYEDNRPEHRSAPPKLWLIGETLYGGKKIKIVFVEYPDGSRWLVTAYYPSQETKDRYKQFNLRDGLEIDI